MPGGSEQFIRIAALRDGCYEQECKDYHPFKAPCCLSCLLRAFLPPRPWIAAARERTQMLTRLLRLLPAETLDGYENPELVEVVFHKTRAFRPSEPWNETAKTVLDFGGGCGLHYKAAGPEVRWAVVETPAMVKRARELSTGQLQFFTSIRAAADWLGEVEMMHSNGALQYTPDPEATLREICALGAKTMLWRRVQLSPGETQRTVQTSRLLDNGPGKISGVRDKKIRYTETRIPERTFLVFHEGYRLAERGPDSFRFVK